MEDSVIFSLQDDISLFFMIRKFLVALRFGKCGVQVLGLKSFLPVVGKWISSGTIPSGHSDHNILDQ